MEKRYRNKIIIIIIIIIIITIIIWWYSWLIPVNSQISYSDI